MSEPRQNDVVNARPALRRPSALKRMWMRVRTPFAASSLAKQGAASAVLAALRFVKATNRVVPGSDDPQDFVSDNTPAIFALWHGQHFMAPLYFPRGLDVVAMVSRSSDAEINALVLSKLGIDVTRGSGGREGARTARKGGTTAFIALKKALDEGRNTVMIADIPHGVPRQAGVGIIKLAKHSGRPIVPVALATSRRVVFEKSWDKTTLSLPFGRVAIFAGEAVFVPQDADDAAIESARQQLTDALNAITAQAYERVDKRS